MNRQMYINLGILTVLATICFSLLSDALTDKRASIKVNSLQFVLLEGDKPYVRQNRTVRGRRAVWGHWQAFVRNSDGTEICKGAGSWPYATGQIVASIPFDGWVGEAGCWDRLVPGEIYQLYAIYHVADNEPDRQSSLGFQKGSDE